MASASQASLLLQKQLKDLCKHPVDGFSAGLVDESNIFEWSVTIIGPPDTLYDGGFFNAVMTFPPDYPNSPPTVRFTSEIWHPNVYPDGKVCISILHPPGDDPNGYELATERWSPVHTVLSKHMNQSFFASFSLDISLHCSFLSCVIICGFSSLSRNFMSIYETNYGSNFQVESIVLSIISMLSSPNDESPANVEAAAFIM
ncbi:Ubiquitin-conjugating enzyme E2 7 [Vitis vinifera]|uniref:Ubiquitin-conjugating enzyme E2 7 n=1 Tax=Vitis vinifera TaxID=29760 RepID=A0A438EP26_VITVI|nr:Ubiquitin-conjugating enzyme E2 7 [Vitis vinifera]